MRLSEAIRLGAMLKPQIRENYDDFRGTCALGAAHSALGCARAFDAPLQLLRLYPFLHRPATCPSCSLLRGLWRRYREQEYDAEDVIIHLNDDHRWTRERIADWVETLEPAPRAGTVERDAVSVAPSASAA